MQLLKLKLLKTSLRWVLKRIAFKLFGPEIDKLLYRIAPERILENPFVSAKRLSPLEDKDKGYYIIPNFTRPTTDELPVPPRELWEGYGDTEKEYLSTGQEDVSNMIDILRKDGAKPEMFDRVLELGCAAARMLRFFPYRPSKSELWGVDIKALTINWCQQHLTPPMLFATTTTFPHLPFEDNYFDLIFAGSVFTHIADMQDAWFLELRRVLRKGGYVYLTIHDKHTVKLIQTKYKDCKNLAWYIEMIQRFDAETNVLSSDYACFSFEGGNWGGFPVPQVFHDVKYLVHKWAPLARLASVNQEAYGYQTALLFQKF